MRCLRPRPRPGQALRRLSVRPAPVTIDRVEWADAEGLTLLSERVFQRSDEDRFATFGVWNGAPARGPKDAENMLILGYRVVANKVDRREAIVVDYSVDGTAYRATFPARLVVCPPPLTDTRCSEKYPHR